MSANDELQAHTCEKILQEYGDIANNVAQSKVQDLTEQWKKGELERGWYYVKKLLRGRYVVDFYYGNDVDRWMDNYDEEIKEVLAPVPSYEEWKTVFNCANKYEVEYIECANDYENVKKENQQLKELLKESAAYVKSVVMVANDCKEYEVAKKHNKLFMDICEAIGEKK